MEPRIPFRAPLYPWILLKKSKDFGLTRLRGKREVHQIRSIAYPLLPPFGERPGRRGPDWVSETYTEIEWMLFQGPDWRLQLTRTHGVLSLIPHPTTAQVLLDRSTGHISPYLRLVPGSSLSVQNPAVISSISVSVIYRWPTTHNCIQVCYLFGITYADWLFRRVDIQALTLFLHQIFFLLVVFTTAKVIKEPPGHWVIAFKAPALVWRGWEARRFRALRTP